MSKATRTAAHKGPSSRVPAETLTPAQRAVIAALRRLAANR